MVCAASKGLGKARTMALALEGVSSANEIAGSMYADHLKNREIASERKPNEYLVKFAPIGQVRHVIEAVIPSLGMLPQYAMRPLLRSTNSPSLIIFAFVQKVASGGRMRSVSPRRITLDLRRGAVVVSALVTLVESLIERTALGRRL